MQINLEDGLLVLGLNRIRHAYVEMEPELASYFITGWHDDQRGFWKSVLLIRSKVPSPGPHFFVTTPTVVALVIAFVAAGEVGLIAQRVTASAGGAILVAVATFFVVDTQRREETPKFGP